ncbi:MAG: hypothetical protein QOJ19_2050 [Acidimicrobiia bacterium]|nr:hypothetical protein [Acidimicrobiia bacterium]
MHRVPALVAAGMSGLVAPTEDRGQEVPLSVMAAVLEELAVGDAGCGRALGQFADGCSGARPVTPAHGTVFFRQPGGLLQRIQQCRRATPGRRTLGRS